MKAFTCHVDLDRVTAYDVYMDDGTVYIGCAVSLHPPRLPSRVSYTDPATWLWRWIQERMLSCDPVGIYTRAMSVGDVRARDVQASDIVRVENHVRGTGWCAECEDVTVRAGRMCVRCQKEAA